MEKNILQPYRIETDRFVLRCWKPSDYVLANQSVVESREHLLPTMEWAKPYPLSDEEIIHLLRGFRSTFEAATDFIYAIFSPDESKVIGGTGFHERVSKGALEIGYWLHKDYVGQGIITESLKLLSTIYFQLYSDLVRLEIHCEPTNKKSAAVAKRLGFTYEGTLRKVLAFQDGSYKDQMIWSLLREEWEEIDWTMLPCKLIDAADRNIEQDLSKLPNSSS